MAKKRSATLAAQAEMQTLRNVGRPKVFLLVAVLMAAMGGAAWAFLSDIGNGNPEDPGKVLVVTTDGGQKLFLQAMGFQADAQTFENLESKAKQEVPDLDDNGVLAIMQLADRFGYGYVVFEQPYNYDFSELETDRGAPRFSDGDRFAVVSAGDMASPHRVTTGGSMLPTMFEQERLAEILPPQQPPTVGAVQLRDQLRNAIDYIEEEPRPPRLRRSRL